MSRHTVPALAPGQFESLSTKPVTDLSTEEHLQMAPFNGCQRRRILRSNVDGAIVKSNCGATRWQDCTYCATLYAGDVRHLMHEGASAPGRQFGSDLVFLTLTAPSYGPVHSAPKFSFADEVFKGRQPKPKKCRCGKSHRPEEGMQGVPLNPTRYRYTDHVRFNSNVSGIMDATLKSLNKRLRRFGLQGTLPYIRVLEMQARFAVHVHMVLLVPVRVLVRLGGSQELRRLVEVTAKSTRYNPQDGSEPIAWGREMKTIIHSALDKEADTQVRSRWLERRSAMLKYLAKYSAKGLGTNYPTLSKAQKAHHRMLANIARERLRPEKDAAYSRIADDDPERTLKQARVTKKFYRIAEAAGCRARVFSKNSAWTGTTLQDRRKQRSDHLRQTQSQAPTDSEPVTPTGTVLDTTTGELIPEWEGVAFVRLTTIARIQLFESYAPCDLARMFAPRSSKGFAKTNELGIAHVGYRATVSRSESQRFYASSPNTHEGQGEKSKRLATLPKEARTSPRRNHSRVKSARKGYAGQPQGSAERSEASDPTGAIRPVS